MKLAAESVWTCGEGPAADVVIATRARLARNLDDTTFLSRASRIQATEIATSIQRAISAEAAFKPLAWHDFAALPPRDRALLVERGLVSEPFAAREGPRGAALPSHGGLAILANEEDHVRIQQVLPGFQAESALRAAQEAESTLSRRLPFAFHSRWGYLTACPTNVGTGLRLSVMAHLPALVLMDQLPRLERAARALHLAIRGSRGEGTPHEGDLYQVSNQVTLGRSAAELTEEFATSIVPEVLEWERAARVAYLERSRGAAIDRAARELAILKAARLMSRDESMKRIGRLRLGVALGLVGGIDLARVTSLILRVQPEHLACERPAAARGVEAERRERATLLREAVAEASLAV